VWFKGFGLILGEYINRNNVFLIINGESKQRMAGINKLTPKQSLNKAYLKEKVTRADIEVFKKNLVDFIRAIDEKESEEHVKNLVTKFLYDTYYHGKNQINTKGRIDLAIYEDRKPVVIIEAKRPNSPDMVSVTNLNAKAMHELILYYLRERIDEGNIDVKYLIATNMYEWFVFDASVFDKLFYKNTELTKDYNDWKNKRKASPTTDSFYSDIAFKFLKSLEEEIPFTWFDLRKVEKLAANSDPKDDSKLIDLFKILSPAHLLKQPFANDSNSLDTKFYSELLHLIGLEERKDGGKKIIQRKEKPDAGSLLENVINTLIAEDRLSELPGNGAEFGEKKEERLFNVGLELCITWINRILFLKLLEGQLLNYHAGDKRFRFLDFKTIPDYDELNKLFFQVLARKQEERTGTTRDKFQHVPYLNSSLFDISPLEADAIRINSLDNGLKLKISSGTVLKTENGKKREGELPMLQYLFEFLDAYDFSSEGKEEIQEENKALINASVLGLIFEKINGYKDGSFFTPGFITMYMCRETIRRAVVQKFSEFLLTPNPLSTVERGKVTTVEVGLPRELLAHAREMRKNQTDAEELLWQLLRNRKLNDWKFRRQHPIREGYILDFYCAETRVAVEVDGPIHNTASQKEYDKNREEVLKEFGIRTIRFTNDEVLNAPEKVLQQIITFSTTVPIPLSTNPLSTVERGPGGEEVTFPDLYNLIGRTISIEQANTLINSLKICDPAVGSGHFLVSALNEIIAIKSELGILSDRQGKVLRDYAVEVINDELIISIDKHDLFEYKPSNKESQRVQEALFHEKQTIIENCLFGVDINPNSVKICRLRLWIELLKNAYYTEPSKYTQLETLPNIDINIKQGNSLISRFALDADLSKALKSIKYNIDDYRSFVNSYKNATDKEEKRGFETLINQIKSDFRTEIGKNDPLISKKNKLGGELYNLVNQAQVFEPTEKEKKERTKKKEKLEAEINKLSEQIEEIKNSAIYKDAFEWRFEFPEVLDHTGNFIGFNVVIGNPPYIRQEELTVFKKYFERSYSSFSGTADILVYFIEKGITLLNPNYHFSFIVANKFLRAGFGSSLRSYINSFQIVEIIDFGDLPVFEEATTYPCILSLVKRDSSVDFRVTNPDLLPSNSLNEYVMTNSFQIDQNSLGSESWNLVNKNVQIVLEKIKLVGVPLEKYIDGNIYRGILTGLNKAFVIDEITKNKLISEDPNSAELIKPFLEGKDIKRYQKPAQKKFVIFTRRGIEIEKYSAIKRHLQKFRSELTPGLPGGRKPGKYHWYEIQDSTAYYLEFDKPKIIYPNICMKPEFTYDESGVYTNQKCFIIPIADRFLLGVLNSSITFFLFRNILPKLRGDFYEPSYVYLKDFPIPKVSDKVKSKISNLVDEILKIKKKNSDTDTTAVEKEIDQLIYQLYGLTEEEIKIVEGVK
jgi:very-short-patch-repair endonuclease